MTLALGTGVSSAAQAADPIPVGAIIALSGPCAAYGIAIHAGLELALEGVNVHGVLGGRKIALMVEDSAGNKEQAIDAARKLIGREKVIAIIGPTLSDEMFAVGPITNERRIPTIGTSNGAVGITAIGPYIFRASLPEADVIPVTLRKAVARGVKSIALMYANDDILSKSGLGLMMTEAEKLGLNIVAIESFGSWDTDFSAQLVKIKDLKPDAVGISALVELVSGVLIQARQLGFGRETLFVGNDGANSTRLGGTAGTAADGLIVGSSWFFGKPDAASQAFVANFRRKYNKDPDQFAAQAYDTMGLLAAAIGRAGSADPARLRGALMETTYSGVLGPFAFTANRDRASADGVMVVEMEGGQFKLAR